jgi:hypothetical protein
MTAANLTPASEPTTRRALSASIRRTAAVPEYVFVRISSYARSRGPSADRTGWGAFRTDATTGVICSVGPAEPAGRAGEGHGERNQYR